MRDATLKPGWSWVRFGDVVRQVKDRVNVPSSGLERYIAGEHMDTDDLRIRRWGTIDDGYLGPAFHMRFTPGQVLYGSRRTYLRKVAVPDFEGICANTTFVLEPKDPTVLLPELLPFIMQTEAFNDHSIKQSKGSVNPYVNFSDLAWYEFALPALEEQRRIAEIIFASQQVIEALSSAIQLVKVLRDSMVIQRSVELSARGVTTLRTVISTIESGSSPGGNGRPAEEDEYGVLKVSAVGHWKFHPDENKVIDVSEFLPALQVRVGDLLATRANADPASVGRTCLVDKTYPGLMLSDKTWRLNVASDRDFRGVGILAWTKSPTFRKHVHSSLGGTDAKNISQKAFLDGPFPLCTESTFNAFADDVEAILTMEKSLERRSEIAQAVKENLLSSCLEY